MKQKENKVSYENEVFEAMIEFSFEYQLCKPNPKESSTGGGTNNRVPLLSRRKQQRSKRLYHPASFESSRLIDLFLSFMNENN